MQLFALHKWLLGEDDVSCTDAHADVTECANCFLNKKLQCDLKVPVYTLEDPELMHILAHKVTRL